MLLCILASYPLPILSHLFLFSLFSAAPSPTHQLDDVDPCFYDVVDGAFEVVETGELKTAGSQPGDEGMEFSFSKCEAYDPANSSGAELNTEYEVIHSTDPV